MTILESAIQILKSSGQPMSAAEIYDEILKADLYKFGAKSPRSVLSGTLRNHLKKSSSPRIVEVSSGTYKVA